MAIYVLVIVVVIFVYEQAGTYIRGDKLNGRTL